MTYQPHPIDTRNATLGDDLVPLIERLAQNAHDIWAAQRIAEGWAYGPERDERRKLTPLLVSYADLPDSEKWSDRKMVLETLRAVQALGFKIVPADG